MSIKEELANALGPKPSGYTKTLVPPPGMRYVPGPKVGTGHGFTDGAPILQPIPGYNAGTGTTGGTTGGTGTTGGNAAQTPAQTDAIGKVGEQLKMLQQKSRDENQARLDAMLKRVKSYGQQAMRDNTDYTGNSQAAATQNLTSRGLGNSTITNSVQQGIARQGQRRADDIGQGVAQQELGVLDGVQNTYPNLGLYAQLLSQQGGAANPEAILKLLGGA